jgi:chromosome partitioning protein
LATVLAIANQKGGVGKTTTAVNLAVGLAELGRELLLVDLDPQANATSGLVPDVRVRNSWVEAGVTTYEAIIGQTALPQIVTAVSRSLFLAPAGPNLVGAEIELVTLAEREKRLASALAPVRQQYDYIIIDTPPSLGLLTLNALVAANAVIIPIQCEYYALEGLSSLLATIRRVRGSLNPQLEVGGILLTMFDSRNRLSHDVAREIREHFGEQVFRSVIPRNVRISESPSHGLSVLDYESRSAGAQSYRALAAELNQRSAPGVESQTELPNSATKVQTLLKTADQEANKEE